MNHTRPNMVNERELKLQSAQSVALAPHTDKEQMELVCPSEDTGKSCAFVVGNLVTGAEKVSTRHRSTAGFWLHLTNSGCYLDPSVVTSSYYLGRLLLPLVASMAHKLLLNCCSGNASQRSTSG